MKELLASADASITDSERDILLKACETHHYHSPDLLRRCKDVVLISLADVLASAICAGVVGSIEGILETSPYLEVSLALIRSLGFSNGLDGEVHHVDLPGQFVEDVFLADMVFRLLATALREKGVVPVMQRGSSLWVVGPRDHARDVLVGFRVEPRELFENVFDERIYDSILSALPAPGAVEIDSLKYVLVNEAVACRLAVGLFTRKSVRTLLERYDLAHVVDRAGQEFAKGLCHGIEAVWQPTRAKLVELLPNLHLPERITDLLQEVANGQVKRHEVGLCAKGQVGTSKGKLSEWARVNRTVLANATEQLVSDVADLLNLFDASHNGNRSLTNVVLELLKMQKETAKGHFGLKVVDVAGLDGQVPPALGVSRTTDTCPVCGRFPQGMQAQALITGGPKADSRFHILRQSNATRRNQIKVCRWCFVAGYVDLPIATIVKEGRGLGKEREYLLIASPLPKEKLQWLIDFIQRGTAVVEEEEPQAAPEQDSLDASELAELEAMMGVSGGYDELAVLGMSRRRLAHLKGFVLPTGNVIGNLMGIRVPTERFVGGRDPKVSGAVRRELVKATMYALHRITGAPSMHFGSVLGDCSFSVAGKPINLEEMRRSNVAYRIADRYARFGRYRQLDSGLFMLLLSNPREAVTQMLRREARGDYAPKEDLIREVVRMAEEIAVTDWRFNLGLKIVSVLVDVDLLPKARSFYKGKEQGFKKFSGVELTKWLQRFKVARDEPTLRQWATQLINALKAGRVASRDFKEARGIEIRPPGEEAIGKIIGLTEEILRECKAHNCRLAEFSRSVANTDYYLLFYHNQRAKEVGQ